MTAIIPEPTPGQPIDGKLLYDLVKNYNEIAKAIDSRKGRVYIKPSESNTYIFDKATANASFFASTFKVSPSSTEVAVDTQTTVKVTFNRTFENLPVVTATPLISGDKTSAATSAIATVTDLTSAGCNIIVTFANPGTVKDLYVQVIAIGSLP